MIDDYVRTRDATHCAVIDWRRAGRYRWTRRPTCVNAQSRAKSAITKVLKIDAVVHYGDGRSLPMHPEPKCQTRNGVRKMPAKVREWISPALVSPDLVLEAQPPAQPHSCVVVECPIRFADGAYLEVVRPAAQRAVQLAHQLCGVLPCHRADGHRMDFLDHAFDA